MAISNGGDSRIMLRILLGEVFRYHHRTCKNMAGWLDLQRQVESAWDLTPGAPDEKYNRLKCRLTTLFLWDKEHEDIARDLDAPPFSVLQVFHNRQRERLSQLPPGQLFIDVAA